MLSVEEMRYLIWVTEQAHEGWGEVVDLGPWVGCSSAALAEGLRRKGSNAVVHSYDLFEWRPFYMTGHGADELTPGADFMPLFERYTAPWAESIRAAKMDLLKGHWDGGEIEILFVDAAKSWELLDAILTVFGPHLEPGRSRVIHQDFRHPFAHWLPLSCDGQPDLWREVEAVQDGSSTTFAPLQPWPPPGGAPPCCEQEYSAEQARAVFGQRIATARPIQRQKFRLALLRKLLFEGDHGGAAQVVADLRREGVGFDGRERGLEGYIADVEKTAAEALLAAASAARDAGTAEQYTARLGVH